MTRLIDADALIRSTIYNPLHVPYITKSDIEAAPTIDAVPVIRCKDCKHWNRNDGMFKDFDGREWHHCPHLGIDTDGYFSCIEGKRKEE